MSKTFIIALAVFAAISLAACSSAAKVEIEGNQSVGDNWVCSITPEGVVRQVSSGYSIFLPLPGMGGTFKFKFEAVAEGEAKILLTNRFRAIPKETITYTAVVDNNKKLTLAKTGYAAEDTEELKAIFKRGETAFHLKDYETAISEFTAAINQSPNYDIAYFYRGIAYHKGTGEREKAIADYKAALRIYPDNSEAKANLDSLLKDTRD